MTDEFADYAEPIGLHILLYSSRNVNDPLSRSRLGNTFVKRLFRNIHQFLSQHPAATDGDCRSRIADEAIVNHPNIETDNIAKPQRPGSSQAVDDLLVHRDADVTRKLTIA